MQVTADMDIVAVVYLFELECANSTLACFGTALPHQRCRCRRRTVPSPTFSLGAISRQRTPAHEARLPRPAGRSPSLFQLARARRGGRFSMHASDYEHRAVKGPWVV